MRPQWGVAGSTIGLRQHPHARLHFARYAIIAHQLARIAQADRFTLHHEQPERMCGLRHQRAALLARRIAVALRIERAQRIEGALQSAPEAPERRGLLLRDLVVERGGGIVGPDSRCKLAGWSDRHSL